jgi:hypothetical protein
MLTILSGTLLLVANIFLLRERFADYPFLFVILLRVDNPGSVLIIDLFLKLIEFI